jgi:adenylate cyclase
MTGYEAFVSVQWLLPMAAPTLGIGIVFFSYYASHSVEEAAARRRVEHAFGYSVSMPIRDYLMASPENLELGGAETEASVLFFDLRGSTYYAESRAPGNVVSEMNMLYMQLVPLIEKHGGLLYRFLGDGFLAVYGAPLPMADHARAACRTGIEIMLTLDALNENRRTEGLDLWQAGCGIHSGRLVYGNIGAPDRAEFTVIGDTVNLAARFEALNKQLDSRIIISAESFRHAGGFATAIGPLEQRIAGRHDPVYVYLLDPSSFLDQQDNETPPKGTDS